MTVNSYENGDFFVYNDKNQLTVSGVMDENNRLIICVFSVDGVAETDVFYRDKDGLRFVQAKNN